MVKGCDTNHSEIVGRRAYAQPMTPAQRAFQVHATTWFAVNAMLFMIWLITTAPGHPWFLYPAMGWGIGLAAHATATYTRPIGPNDDDDELEAGDAPYRSLGR